MPSSKVRSSILAKYLSMYEKDPESRVFAPLAESYRKLGMLDEAFGVLKDGLKKHPTYLLGYVVLSQCYLDKEEYQYCYDTLRPFVKDNRDNILLQKVYGLACEKLGYLEEALDAFKYLLLINPRDDFFAQKVKLLEDDLNQTRESVLPVRKAERPFGNEDDWVQVDFTESKTQSIPDQDSWKIEDNSKKEDPFINLTLVDLYCSQGYFDKAYDIIEKFEELHPNNGDIKKKKEYILSMLEDGSPDEGHEKLLNIIDSKVKNHSKINDFDVNDTLIKKLNLFLAGIKNRASQISG